MFLLTLLLVFIPTVVYADDDAQLLQPSINDPKQPGQNVHEWPVSMSKEKDNPQARVVQSHLVSQSVSQVSQSL